LAQGSRAISSQRCNLTIHTKPGLISAEKMRSGVEQEQLGGVPVWPTGGDMTQAPELLTRQTGVKSIEIFAVGGHIAGSRVLETRRVFRSADDYGTASLDAIYN
jgi:hypothetical protein